MDKEITLLLAEWSNELVETLVKDDSYCVALFSTDEVLLLSNKAFMSLIKDTPSPSFIHPTFAEILEMESNSNLIFEGLLTLGDYSLRNKSIQTKIFRKQNKLLVVGGVDIRRLVQQNIEMHKLNTEVTRLQHDLIKKNSSLEHTLSQLNSVIIELKKINTDKNKLLQIIAHDLRSSINSILGLTEALVGDITEFEPEEVQNCLSLINSSAENTSALLDNLLNWSKTQTGKIVFNPEKLVLSQVIQEVIEISHTNAKLKTIHLKQIQDKYFEVYADYDMLKTVLRNLVANAIKFTKPEGHISISASTYQNQAEITISDDGVGINEETLKKLFDPGINITLPGTADERGSGLGLALCKEFVEKNNGKIWVESVLGKGSKFKFTLPLEKIV